LPSTTAYIPPDDNRHPNYTPTPPTEQALPAQEQGTRPARALPYELYAHGDTDFSTGSFNLHFANLGKAAALQVRSGNSSTGPWTYTVGRGHELSDNFAVTAEGLTAYDLSAYGPNGFLRAFKGAVAKQSAHLEVRNAYEIQGNGIVLFIRNLGLSKTEVRVTDAYTGDTFKQTLHPGEALERTWHLDHSHGWYDLTVTVESDASFSRQLAGHVETGNDSVTDPAIAS
jgi:phospholipase C